MTKSTNGERSEDIGDSVGEEAAITHDHRHAAYFALAAATEDWKRRCKTAISD